MPNAYEEVFGRPYTPPQEVQPKRTGTSAVEEVFGRQADEPKGPPIYRNMYDVTLGSLTYGGAELGRLAAKGLPFGVDQYDPIVKFAATMDRFKSEHPEYSPKEVDSAWDLIKDPMALSSRVFNGFPQMAAGVAALSAPYVGLPLAASLNATVESARTYEDAKRYVNPQTGVGATEDEAIRAGRSAGLASAFFDVMTQTRVLNFAKGQEGYLARETTSRAARLLRAAHLPADAVGLVMSTAALGAAQGAVNDGIASMTYGKDVEEGFWDRRMQEAIGGAATAATFGQVLHYFTKQVPQPDGTQKTVRYDAYDRDSFREFLVNEHGMEQKPAAHVAETVDAFARQWASRNNQPVEAFYGQFVAGPNESLGQNLADSAQGIPKIFGDAEPKKVIRNFIDTAQMIMSPADVQILKDNNLNTPKQISDTFTRYLTEGVAPAPELVEPFEAFKETFKDLWTTTKASTTDVELAKPTIDPMDMLAMLEQTAGGGKRTRSVRELVFGTEYTAEGLAKSLGQEGRPDFIPSLEQQGLITKSPAGYTLNREVFEPQAQPELTSQLRSVFDRLLSIDTDQIAEARQRLYKGESDLLKIKEVAKPAEDIVQHINSLREEADTYEGVVSTSKRAFNNRRALEEKLSQTPPGTPEFVNTKLLIKKLDVSMEKLHDREVSALLAKRTVEQFDQTQAGITPSQDVPVVDPDKGITIQHIPGTIEQQESVVKSMYDDLKRLQLGRLMPDRDSAVARRAAPGGVERDLIKNEDPEQVIIRIRFQSALDAAEQFFAQYSAPLKNFKNGLKALDWLSDVRAHQRNLNSEFTKENTRIRMQLTRRDRNWLSQVDEAEAARTGLRLTNMRRLLDKTGVPNPIDKAPTDTIRQYAEQNWKVLQVMGKMAEREGVVITMADGKDVPYKQPGDPRMFRFYTDDARAAIEKRSGPMFEAMREGVRQGAKLAGKEADLSGIEKAVYDSVKGTGIRESGPLTDARKVPYMMSEVMVNGVRKQVLHENPDSYLDAAVRTQAYQLGWHRVVGVSDLEPVKSKQLKSLLEGIGVEPVYNSVTLRKKIAEKGIDLPANVTDMKVLEKYVEVLGGQPKPGRKEYLAGLDKLTVNDFTTSERQAALREAAVEMQGIDPKAPIASVLDEIKRRAVEKLSDPIEILKSNLRAEGGDIDLLTDVIKLSQGIPIYKSRRGEFRERQVFVRAAHFAGGLIGTAQTSTSVVPNLFQTFVQIPQMVGIRNFVGAFNDVVKNPAHYRDAQIAMGSISDVHQAWALEPGYRLEGITRNMRQAVQTGTFMKFVGDLNNVIAGEAFNRLAKQWKADPSTFDASAERLARRLELTPAQIKEIKSGQMQPDNLTFRKIVQEGVAKTQFVTESAHNRAILENHPIWRMLFAYNSYAAGTARSSLELMRSGREALANSLNDPSGLIKHSGRLLALAAGALGAGAMTEMMRDVTRGNTSQQQNEDLLDRAAAAALSVQLFGPPQRLLESIKYDTGSSSNWVVGLMPQVRALVDGIAVGYNAALRAAGEEGRYGKYAKFGTGEDVKQMAIRHTPLAKAFVNWFHNTAYPDEPIYNEVKANVAQWKKDKLGEKNDPAEYQLNPMYQDVFTWTKRDDPEQAMKAVQVYYDDFVKKFEKDPDTAVLKGLTFATARTGLRESLKQRAPLNLRPELIPVYLSSLPPDKAEQFLIAHKRYMTIVNAVAPGND